MRIAYLDVFVGISGDMFLGALVHTGAPLEVLRASLAGLPDDVELTAEQVTKSSIRATQVHVQAAEHHRHQHHHAHRSYRDLAGIMTELPLPAQVRERAEQVLRRLAEAEGAVHGVPTEEVHFHELAGLDTIVDIVGTIVGLEALGIQRLYCSPLPLSHGYVDTAHGRLPVPPPAVMELLRGVPTVPVEVEGETVTPTGAALAVVLADEWGSPPPMTLQSVAYGAGSKDFPGTPNVLRMLVGETEAGRDLLVDYTVLIETNLDDMNPELQPALMEALFAAGALDAWLTPIQMKKGRPALLVTALAAPEKAEPVARAMLQHSSSFGVRMQRCERRCLPRQRHTVQTPWGPVAVNVGKLGGQPITASPEFEDCARLATEHKVPVKQVYAAALGAATELLAADHSKREV